MRSPNRLVPGAYGPEVIHWQIALAGWDVFEMYIPETKREVQPNKTSFTHRIHEWYMVEFDGECRNKLIHGSYEVLVRGTKLGAL